MKKYSSTKLVGITFLILSPLLGVYFYIFSYTEMLKLCRQLAFKGSVLACFYDGPMSPYWISLTSAILGFFVLGAALVLIDIVKNRRSKTDKKQYSL